MYTLYFVPQMPVAGRYTQWWLPEFVTEFEKHFDRVIVLGHDLIQQLELKRDKSKDFSNIDQSVRLEIAQIKDYLEINEDPNDVLFFADISFPGIFANVLFTKKFIGKKFAFCHASSKNKFDFFSDVRKSKFRVETGQAMLFDKIFVGSQYHKEKLGWNNIQVTRLPAPPKKVVRKLEILSKKYAISSVSRFTVQKVQKKIEKRIQSQLGIKIIRKILNNPFEYSKFLSESKVLLITSKEDTFNYTIMDAIRCGTVPIAPNTLCFPEILSPEYLFNNTADAIIKVKKALLGETQVPERMLCQDEVDNFFNVICKEMLKI